ncbi:MAG: SymE family type I addiction module toxin [Chitinophagaceae bacterium]|nr:SymE family type I addiction module toxin [Chitinophagaceae bacterium]
MEPNKNTKKNPIKRPDVRSLKIQTRHRSTHWSDSTAPEIKLCGHWLEQLGFTTGKRVVITTMKELLIINLHPE